MGKLHVKEFSNLIITKDTISQVICFAVVLFINKNYTVI